MLKTLSADIPRGAVTLIVMAAVLAPQEGHARDRMVGEIAGLAIDLIGSALRENDDRPIEQHGENGSRQSGAGDGSRSYDRDLYGGWIDGDGNCLDTRADVLAAASTGPVSLRKSGCTVGHGRWHDPYTGRIFTDAGDVDIDHLVPLAWAHAHGGWAWDEDRKKAFATWTPNLFPVMASANREKGAKGPDEWLPPRVEYRCEYLLRFERIAGQWDLAFEPRERESIEDLKGHYCPAGY